MPSDRQHSRQASLTSHPFASCRWFICNISFHSPRCYLREAVNARSRKGCKLFRVFAGKGLAQVKAPI